MRPIQQCDHKIVTIGSDLRADINEGNNIPDINVMCILHGGICKDWKHVISQQVELQEGGVFELPQETEERGIYALSGEVEIAGIKHSPNQLLVFRPGDQVVVKALSPVRMMVLGGAAMDGPRHIWWNFVSSDKERIEQAKDDWRNGKFATVDGDDEFIPLPE